MASLHFGILTLIYTGLILVCPQLWIFRTCGNTTCGAIVFPPDKVMHCMILGWKTDMMGLMLPKVVLNAIVLVPVGEEPNKIVI